MSFWFTLELYSLRIERAPYFSTEKPILDRLDLERTFRLDCSITLLFALEKYRV